MPADVFFTQLREKIRNYDPINSNLPGLRESLEGRRNQNTFLTPEQFSNLFRQRTQPAIDTLTTLFNRQLGEGRSRLASNFASRGQLFGGSLTGAQAKFESGQNENFLNQIQQLLGQAGSDLGTLDLQLGAQKQLQGDELLVRILQTLLGGQSAERAAKAGKPSGLNIAGIGGISF